MASITFYILATNESFPVEDIDLESVTPVELLNSAVEEGVLPRLEIGRHYYCLNKEGKRPFIRDDEGKKTLRELGFCDGDTIKVLSIAPGQ